MLQSPPPTPTATTPTTPIQLWLRAETTPKDRRVVLTPSACKSLIDRGTFKISVEKSVDRVFADEEYQSIGCQLVETGEWHTASHDTLILGLGDLNNPNNTSTTTTTAGTGTSHNKSPLIHTHLFFSQSLKHQNQWTERLQRFDIGKGTLLDLDLLTNSKETSNNNNNNNNNNNSSKLGFGYFEGFSGAVVGLDAWSHQQLEKGMMLKGYEGFESKEAAVEYVKKRMVKAVAANKGEYPQVMILGSLNESGSGARDLARLVGIPEVNLILWDHAETIGGGPFPRILESEIFINCLHLDETPTEPFLTSTMLQEPSRVLSVIVDVAACDGGPTNYKPIPVYSVKTTFENPVVEVVAGTREIVVLANTTVHANGNSSDGDSSGVGGGNKEYLSQGGFGAAIAGSVLVGTAVAGGSAVNAATLSSAQQHQQLQQLQVQHQQEQQQQQENWSHSIDHHSPPPLDVCSIDNLSALIPKQSSEAFSSELVGMMIELEKKDRSQRWRKAQDVFEERVVEMKMIKSAISQQ